MGLVLDRWPYTPGVKMVAVALLDCASDIGDSCFPGAALLARRSGTTEQHVRRCLLRFREDDGWLVLAEQGGGRGNRNGYRIDIEVLQSGPKPEPEIPESEIPESGSALNPNLSARARDKEDPSVDPSLAAFGEGSVPSEDQSQSQEREPLKHPLGGGVSQRVGGVAGSHVPPIVEKGNDSAPLRYRDAASVAGSREVSPVTKESQLHETEQGKRRNARPAGARMSRPPQTTPSPSGRPSGERWLSAAEKRQQAYSDFLARLEARPPLGDA